MSIGAILPEVTLLLLLKVLANLCLIVVVRNVEHLVLNFHRQLLLNKNNVVDKKLGVLKRQNFSQEDSNLPHPSVLTQHLREQNDNHCP